MPARRGSRGARQSTAPPRQRIVPPEADSAPENLDQRRFASAVRAKQAVDLARCQREIDMRQRDRAVGEGLGDAFQFKERRAHHWPTHSATLACVTAGMG
jgi:hypothetical protein